MSNLKITITTGFAIFAMFFGSGNLVFPLSIGMQTGHQFLLASLGLIITGVLVPFLGIFSMVLYQGNRDQYFGLLGKWAPFILTALMLSLLGPFGVVPRCIIVAYGGMNLLWENLPFPLFSVIFCLSLIALTWQKNKIIPIIGKFLTPILILGIIFIVIAAIHESPELTTISNPASTTILIGLFEGYQTMDLLAAFFFSITTIEYLHQICKNKEEAIKVSLAASALGAALLAIVYIGFVALGAYYGPYLGEINPEHYLSTIANLTLGKTSLPLVATIILLACLTTAVSLTGLFAEFLRKDVAHGKISWPISLIITALISFLLSLTGFAAISKILAAILTYIYPALIVLTLAAIINKYIPFKQSKKAFWLTILMTLGCKLFL